MSVRNKGDKEPEVGTARVEAFFDAVLAIVLTILVLELHSPSREQAAAIGFFKALSADWPSYVAYLLSFAVIGSYWLAHHRFMTLVRSTNHLFNLLTLALLLSLSTLPFATAVLGEHLGGPAGADASRLYVAAMALPSGVWCAGFAYARRAGLLSPNLDKTDLHRRGRTYAASFAIHVAAIVVSFVIPVVAVLAALALPVFYLLPERTRTPEIGA
ncbi:MAG: TMEM175 family protein [Pyrinomonadaceae bacterium]